MINIMTNNNQTIEIVKNEEKTLKIQLKEIIVRSKLIEQKLVKTQEIKKHFESKLKKVRVVVIKFININVIIIVKKFQKLNDFEKFIDEDKDKLKA